MGNTHEGALKAAEKNKEYDPDFYKKIGKIGGKARVKKGFAVNLHLAAEAGRKGGKASRRPRKVA